MRVISQGRDQQSWAQEEECTGNSHKGGGCGAKLLVEEVDVFHSNTGSQSDPRYAPAFKCPLCNCVTNVTEPPGWMWYAVQGRKEPRSTLIRPNR